VFGVGRGDLGGRHVRLDVDRADDVRVLDLRGRHRLAEEPGPVLRLAREPRADGLRRPQCRLSIR
jgi:hypothetical protein